MGVLSLQRLACQWAVSRDGEHHRRGTGRLADGLDPRARHVQLFPQDHLICGRQLREISIELPLCDLMKTHGHRQTTRRPICHP